MEYAESMLGKYDSTIGFLKVLTALVMQGGCPSNLGEKWRPRTGCSPYIEYAMDLVLPRALGVFNGYPPLPFRSTAERNKLCTAALELIYVSVSRYLVPKSFMPGEAKNFAESLRAAKAEASKKFELDAISSSLVASPNEEDFHSFCGDFHSSSLVRDNFQTPPSKSVGFTILAATLRNDSESFFGCLASTLSMCVRASSVPDVDDLRMSFALFGSLRPSFENSRRALKLSASKLSKLLAGLENDDSSYASASVDLEKASSYALKIICVVLSREAAFFSAIRSADLDRMAPVLNFKQPSSTVLWNLKFSETFEKLNTSELIDIFPYLINGFHDNIGVPSLTVTVLLAMKNCRHVIRVRQRIGRAFNELLRLLAEQSPFCRQSANLLAFILGSLVKELRSDEISPLLEPLTRIDTMESLVHAASFDRFVYGEISAGVAALCFETIFMLNRKHDDPWYLMNFLDLSIRSLRFGARQGVLARCPKEVLLSLAWALRTASDNLCRSTGVDRSVSVDRKDYDLIRGFCQHGVLAGFFELLPANDQTGYAHVLSDSLHLLLGAVFTITSQTSLKLDLTYTIQVLLKKMGEDHDITTQRNLAMSLYMSVYHHGLALLPTDDLVSGISHALIRVPTARAILAATLVLCLQRSHKTVIDNQIVQQVLENLICLCCDVSDDFPPVPTSDAVIARTTLKLLCESASDEVVQRVLVGHKSAPLDQLISLASRLDQNVCGVLSLVSQLPSGSSQLLKSGMLTALEHAVKAFLNYSEVVQKNSVSTPSIGVPPFLFDHLQLMSCILLNVPRSQLLDATRQVYNILKLYDPIISQAIQSFPSDGNTTGEYLRCRGIVQRILLLMSFQNESESRLTYSLLPKFVFSLIENPLPRSYRTTQPPNVLKEKETQVSRVFTHSDEAMQSWWDKLPSVPTGDDFVCLAKQAADMMLNGLYAIEMDTFIRRIGPARLGRALIAVVDSIKVCIVCIGRKLVFYSCISTVIRPRS